MQLKTILNRLDKHRSFVYGEARFIEADDAVALEVEIRARSNGRPICSSCGCRRPGYDVQPPRSFEHVPLWGLRVFFRYAPRRVNCTLCGVLVEALPWATGKQRMTTAYAWFLASWAKRLSWTDVAEVFGTSWDSVFRAVEIAVKWGRDHRDLSAISSIGIDEIQWQHGHMYLTLDY